MTIDNLRTHLVNASIDKGKFDRLYDVLDLLARDLQFVQYAHAKYLPVCAQYQSYIHGYTGADGRLIQARQIRAQLGGVSRWMYAKQKETFKGIVTLLVPSPLGALLPDVVLDGIWRQWVQAERRWLAAGRR